MLTLDPEPGVITFACYGILVKWHRALQDSVRAILSWYATDDGADHDQVAAVAERFRQEALARQQRPSYRNYKTTLRSSLSVALAEVG